MDQILDEITEVEKAREGKVFKENSIWVGVYLGGPLVAGYFLTENFKVFNQVEKVQPTWIITILATIIIFSGVFLIPDSVNIPNQIIPLIYTGIAFGLFKKYQGQNIEAHLKKGGLPHNWGRVIVVSLIGLVITTLPIIGFGLMQDSIAEQNLMTKKYGTTVVHEIDFYKNNIEESDVDDIAEGLIYTGFFDEFVPKYLLLEKEGNKYVIYISTVNGIQNNEEALQSFVDLRNDLDAYFPMIEIELKLFFESYDNVIKTIQ